jgi:hypothetical protein
MRNPMYIGQHHIFQVKQTLVISGLKLMKTITFKQILFKAKKSLTKFNTQKKGKKRDKNSTNPTKETRE